MIEIPLSFAQRTVAREGERGAEWIAVLPGLLDELLQRWNCTPAAPPRHGHVGVVLPVRHPDLPPVVLKVSFPHPGNVHEPDAYTVWAGRGAVTLYERDDERFAMLLEQAEPETPGHLDDIDEAIITAGRLARRLAVPAPDHLPRLKDRVGQWEAEIRANAGRLPRNAIGAAITTLCEIGTDQPETLVHGDLHHGNILRSRREPWLAIDPKGQVGDPAYDAITVIGSHHPALLASHDPLTALHRCMTVFAEAAELDLERVQRWTQARAVIAGIHAREHGDPEWRIQASDLVAMALA